MPEQQISERLVAWGSDIEAATIEQAKKATRLSVVSGHVALMPDAHVGLGATIGSVIPTDNAVIPAAVGVDIGCGMVAAEFDLVASDLPDDLNPVLDAIARVVPSGVGRGHREPTPAAVDWFAANPAPGERSDDDERRAAVQFGTLGSGNHFVELCLDERDRVWLVLHSGSRGIGKRLAERHIERAQVLARELGVYLEDRNLAHFLDSQPEFHAYIADMLWAQAYAYANRGAMVEATSQAVLAVIGKGAETSRINCHHNFTQRERHGDRDLWITRKGAIKAAVGDLGVIPGSMGTRTYIVAGKGNPRSWNSCSHGAGRRHSRSAARRLFSAADLAEQMGERTWLRADAGALVDEIPAAYKDIDQVMADQADLVEVRHVLRQLVNYKGV